jgi:hypothetical protein
MSLQGSWGPSSKQEIAYGNLVPRSLTGTFFENPVQGCHYFQEWSKGRINAYLLNSSSNQLYAQCPFLVIHCSWQVTHYDEWIPPLPTPPQHATVHAYVISGNDVSCVHGDVTQPCRTRRHYHQGTDNWGRGRFNFSKVRPVLFNNMQAEEIQCYSARLSHSYIVNGNDVSWRHGARAHFGSHFYCHVLAATRRLLCLPRGLLCNHIERCRGCHYRAVKMAANAEDFYPYRQLRNQNGAHYEIQKPVRGIYSGCCWMNITLHVCPG